MWSYRLYRYPSPSSSSLVYGSGKTGMDEEMSPNCPQSIANAVFKALEGGGKLPYFDSTEEVRKALLNFVPNSHHPASRHSELDNGNDSLKQGKASSAEKGKRKGEQTEDDLQSKKGKRNPRQPPILMLEALSRRRMDAVQQLHGACPQLLASIPLFDPAESSPLPLRPKVSQGTTTLWATPGSSPVQDSPESASFLPTSDSCPLQQRSYLLDVAAENKALLVFVLEQHPEVSNQQLQAQTASRSDSLEDDEDGDGLNQLQDARSTQVHSRYLQTVGTERELQSDHADGDVFGILSATTEDTNENEKEAKVEVKSTCNDPKGEDDPLTELDPTSPITICIRKNNIEVLRYLFFKHVWQHFLLDDMFKLNQVSGSDTQELSSSCPECTGFLPCAALTGCPYLLDLLLCGKFCTHSSAACLQRSTRRAVKSGESELDIKDEDDTPKGAGVTDSSHERSAFVSQIGNQKEKGKGPTSDNAEDLCPDNANTPTPSTVPVDTVCRQGSQEHMDAMSSCGSTQETFTKSSEEYGNIPEHTEAANSNIPQCVSDPPRENVLLRSGDSDTTSKPSGSSPCRAQETVPYPGCAHNDSDYESSNFQAIPDAKPLPQDPQVPDPNFLVPISLPIMDRWISRCMHVRLTPLHLACWRCDPGSIRVLLRHGAQVNLMAEELDSSSVKQGSEGNVLDSGESRVVSTPSSGSSLDQALHYVSVTVNSSSVDMAVSNGSAEDQLKKQKERGGEGERAVLTPLALLALGIRSPPDFSLSIGRSLGLVLPTLPVLWGGQMDRSCPQANLCLMEAMRLLLDAGCNPNQVSTVFGKTFSVMELFLQPSVDLYYAPLMPRGGRDSAVLRCMDLEHVAELVLSACWELCSRGARLGSSFSGSIEWNLFHMDWMFLKNEILQRRVLHLAIFLGLFPSLEPAVQLESMASCGKTSNLPEVMTADQRKAGASRGGMDITQPHLPPYTLPPRPSCIPWAPSTSMTSTPPLSDSSSIADREESPVAPVTLGTEQLQQLQSTEVVTSYYSSIGTQSSLPDNRVAAGPDVLGGSPAAGSRASIGFISEASSLGSWSNDGADSVIDLRSNASVNSEEFPPALNNIGGVVTATVDSQDQRPWNSVGGSMQDELQRRPSADAERESTNDEAISSRADAASNPRGTVVSGTFHDRETPSTTRTANDTIETSEPAPVPAHPGSSASETGAGVGGTRSRRYPTSSSVMRVQMTRWALEERQRRCLEKFANDVLRLSVPEHSLSLILNFMCMSDLRLLASITQHMLSTAPVTIESTLHRFHNAVCNAQSRSLRHCCKLVILAQSGWRRSALDYLPLPDSLKRYLIDQTC